jgi:flagellar protein FliO/FliZ
MQLFNNPIANAFVVMILFVAGLAVLLFYLKRLAEKQRSVKNRLALDIIAKQPVTPKSQIMVVEIEGEKYMLGVTENNINLLTKLGDSSSRVPSQESSRLPHEDKESFLSLFKANMAKQMKS